MSDKQYATKDEIQPLEDAFRTLNREMGVVQGELKWIKIILTGSFVVGIVNVLLGIFG